MNISNILETGKETEKDFISFKRNKGSERVWSRKDFK